MGKFIFKDTQGETVGKGEGENPTQAARAAGITEYYLAVDDTKSPESSASEAAQPEPKLPGEKKSRKPRAAKGLPKAKAAIKKRRTVYHLISGVIQTFESKDALDAGLADTADLPTLKVIDGGSVRSVECQKKWTLK